MENQNNKYILGTDSESDSDSDCKEFLLSNEARKIRKNKTLLDFYKEESSLLMSNTDFDQIDFMKKAPLWKVSN